MQRFARYDVSREFATPAGRVTAQVTFGLVCAGAMLVLRSLLDMWAPTAGPFALVYPTVLVATLYGHLLAGAVAYLVSFAWAWWFVLPVTRSFQFEVPADASRVAINAAAVLVVALLAESFRRAVAEAGNAREAEIERRGMLLAELEHRTRNNFSLVVSLLEMQRRRAKGDDTREALDQATARVHSFAGAYTNLASSQGEGTEVDMKQYLTELVSRVSPTLFDDNVSVNVSAEKCILPRQTAVAIGLFVNEALTNCAKYAFPDRQAGLVRVRLNTTDDDWNLIVRDDGLGATTSAEKKEEKSPAPSSGLGTSLMQAFAQQAEAEYFVEETEKGRTVGLRTKAD